MPSNNPSSKLYYLGRAAYINLDATEHLGVDSIQLYVGWDEVSSVLSIPALPAKFGSEVQDPATVILKISTSMSLPDVSTSSPSDFVSI